MSGNVCAFSIICASAVSVSLIPPAEYTKTFTSNSLREVDLLLSMATSRLASRAGLWKLAEIWAATLVRSASSKLCTR